MSNFVELNMDAFSDGQMRSKLWLCEELEKVLGKSSTPMSLQILGSWYGSLALLLLIRNQISFTEVHLYDLDSSAMEIAKKLLDHWRFLPSPRIHFHPVDVNTLSEPFARNAVVINTAIEHFSLSSWWNLIPEGGLYVAQSTNMPHSEHINPVHSLDHLLKSLELKNPPLFSGTKDFNYPNLKFQRYMIIGRK